MRPRDQSWLDVALGAAVSVLTFGYLLYVWPKILVQLDEGPFIYEAKRILDGEVMYRDFFDLTGPLGQHLLALMYAVAGVSMETARGGTALLHGIMAALMYAIMRRLDVRPTLAAVCCLTDLALFYPAFAMATSHWFSTTFAMVTFWFVLRAPVAAPRRALLAGALTALVGLSHQPKGAATAAAVCAVLVWDTWKDRRGTFLGDLARSAGGYALGLGAAVLGPLAILVALAGFWPLFEALVLIPLGPYRDVPFHSQGSWMPLKLTWPLFWLMASTASTFLILNLMPLIVPVAAVRFVLRQRRFAAAYRRRSFVALIFGASAIASVLYLPNHSHFAIVGPLWLPLYGELLERAIRRVEHAVRAAWVGPVAVGALCSLVLLRVAHDLPAAWASVGATDRSAFGAVDFASHGEVADIAAVRAALAAAGATEIFVYPSAAALYLMTETSNPTRFQLLIPDYNTEAQFAEVAEVLQRERVPFVVRNLYLWGDKTSPHYRPDLLLPHLQEHYEPVRLQRDTRAVPTLTLFRRKDLGHARDAASPPR